MKINWTIKKIMFTSLTVVGIIMAIVYSGSLFEEVNSDEIVVIQHPLSGQLDVYTTAGTKPQYLGIATHYKKRSTIWFSKHKNQGDTTDQSIKIRFNDGGHATISGAVSMELPMDVTSVIAFHSKFGSQSSIEHDLVTTVIEKSVYMTGPIMSSKESYAEKKNELLLYIEDQASHGVYKTTQKDVITNDPFTNAEKIVTTVDIQKDKNGNIIRNEKSPLQDYNIKLSNLSINYIDYEGAVEKQIKAQQDLTMQVQTAIANAKKSEQDALTAEQKGKADAAKAKWDQEVIKATLVTKAQQQKEVAALEAQAAILEAQKTRTDADAEAYKNSKLVSAGLSPTDRADYEMKTKIGVAEALSKIQLPSTYMSGSNGNGGGSMLEQILGARLLEQSMTPKK